MPPFAICCACVLNVASPDLVKFERGSIIPFAPSLGPVDTLPSAYELLKVELEYYVRNHFEATESLPSDDDLKYEGCSVIFGSEYVSRANAGAAATPLPPDSWLRDLFLSCRGDAATRARFCPMGQLIGGRMTKLQINGKGNIFENCELEAQLRQYVGAHAAMGADPSDSDIQQAACAVLKGVDSSSPNPSQRFVGFLARLVWESTGWLTPLRQRAEQDLSGDADLGMLTSFDRSPVSGVPDELGMFGFHGTPAYPRSPFLPGTTPGAPPPEGNGFAIQPEPSAPLDQELPDFFLRLHNPRPLFAGPGPSPGGGGGGGGGDRLPPRGHGIVFSLNDSHRYLRLAGELSRFVASTMSPNNPTSHVPSDDELRHQARWILYDE